MAATVVEQFDKTSIDNIEFVPYRAPDNICNIMGSVVQLLTIIATCVYDANNILQYISII